MGSTRAITRQKIIRGRIKIKLEEVVAKNALPDSIFNQIMDLARRVSDEKMVSDEEAKDIFHGKREIGILPQELRSSDRKYSGLETDYSTWQYYLA